MPAKQRDRPPAARAREDSSLAAPGLLRHPNLGTSLLNPARLRSNVDTSSWRGFESTFLRSAAIAPPVRRPAASPRLRRFLPWRRGQRGPQEAGSPLRDVSSTQIHGSRASRVIRSILRRSPRSGRRRGDRFRLAWAADSVTCKPAGVDPAGAPPVTAVFRRPGVDLLPRAGSVARSCHGLGDRGQVAGCRLLPRSRPDAKPSLTP